MMAVGKYLLQSLGELSLTYPEKAPWQIISATKPGIASQFLLSCHTQSSDRLFLWRVGIPGVPASYHWFVGHTALLTLSE